MDAEYCDDAGVVLVTCLNPILFFVFQFVSEMYRNYSLLLIVKCRYLKGEYFLSAYSEFHNCGKHTHTCK
jgi:hypothetical protein